MKKNLHQLAAEKARSNILKAARILFCDKGFSGTSIGAIAKAAKINQSLIYHYFHDKEDLWRQVKSEIIKTTLGDEHLKEAPPIETLDELLDHLVKRRFLLYWKNRDLVRLLLWQALEEGGASISGTSEVWIKSWLKVIGVLQKKKRMSTKLTPYEVLLCLNGVVWAPFVTAAVPKVNEDPEQFCHKMTKELKQFLE